MVKLRDVHGATPISLLSGVSIGAGQDTLSVSGGALPPVGSKCWVEGAGTNGTVLSAIVVGSGLGTLTLNNPATTAVSGGKAAGGVDASAAILAAAKQHGEVILDAPYVLDAPIGQLPPGVTIRGCGRGGQVWGDSTRAFGQGPPASPFDYPSPGLWVTGALAGTNVPIISTGGGCYVGDLYEYHPGQRQDSAVISYPWFVYASLFGDTVENVGLVNTYQGVWLAGPATARRVIGQALSRGILVDGPTDIARVKECQFSVWWDDGHNPASQCFPFQAANGTAFEIGRADDVRLSDLYCFRYNKGLNLTASPLAYPDGVQSSYGMGSRLSFDSCQFGVNVQGTRAGASWLLNGLRCASADLTGAGPNGAFDLANYTTAPHGAIRVVGGEFSQGTGGAKNVCVNLWNDADTGNKELWEFVGVTFRNYLRAAAQSGPYDRVTLRGCNLAGPNNGTVPPLVSFGADTFVGNRVLGAALKVQDFGGGSYQASDNTQY